MGTDVWMEKILWILGKADETALRRCYILLLELIGRENILGGEHEQEDCAIMADS